MTLLLQRAVTWLSALVALAVVLAAGALAPIVIGRPMPFEFSAGVTTRMTTSGLKVLNVYVGPHATVNAGRDSSRTFPTFSAYGGYLFQPASVRLDGSVFRASCDRPDLLDAVDPCYVAVTLAVPKGVQLEVHISRDGYFDSSDEVVVKSITRG